MEIVKIHLKYFRDEDFSFVLAGISRLLMNPFLQTNLPYSQRKVRTYSEGGEINDFSFMLAGISPLLMNPILQTYLPYSQRLEPTVL